MHLERNPVVDDRLVAQMVEVWTAVTEAGGAVGFLPGTPRAAYEREAARALRRVDEGDGDLVTATDDEGVLVGFVFLERDTHPLAPHLGVVKRLQRHPRIAGGGVGAALLRATEELARDRGLSVLTLTVRGGTGRERFYAAHGYRLDGRLPARLQLGDGTLIEELYMSKELTGAACTSRAEAHTAPVLRVRRLDPELPLPSRARTDDAGLDLYAAEPVVLEPGQRALVATGVAIAVPPGCVGLVHPRSGLAARSGVGIVNAPGTIDAGYRGEVKVILVNLDRSETVHLERGDRIAQLLVQRVEPVVVEAVETLDETVRGEGGFGSSGR